MVTIKDIFRFLGALFLVLLVLKVIGQLEWSWLWVTAPVWGPPTLWFGFAFVLPAISSVIQLILDVALHPRSWRDVRSRRRAIRRLSRVLGAFMKKYGS